ncbi:MAG: addiction module protein [Candidatus Leucobacter sulfamidivorax]|nr:addiction module protein [Candidatus Leucobacter sulfamidivorax]
MNAHVLEVERALLALNHHERAAVIHHGLQSLEDENSIEHDHAEVDAAWRSELRQRIDDIENGKVELLDTDEVFASIRADLAARRK